jgi:hypothetical protein
MCRVCAFWKDDAVTIEIKCLRCQTPMQEGFMADLGYGQIQQARWCAGKPNPSFWTGEVKGGQMMAGTRVLTYRCPNCGYLESYAPAPSQSV